MDRDEAALIYDVFLKSLSTDALRIAVRGFHDRITGDQIVQVLSGLGFEIVGCFSGESDTLGGLIETHITRVDELQTDDLEEIRKQIYVAADSIEVFIQYEKYYRTQDWEM